MLTEIQNKEKGSYMDISDIFEQIKVCALKWGWQGLCCGGKKSKKIEHQIFKEI